MTKRINPVEQEKARRDSAQADSIAAEAHFQAGRRRALAQMNPPKPDPLGDLIRGLARTIGLHPAKDALDKSTKK